MTSNGAVNKKNCSYEEILSLKAGGTAGKAPGIFSTTALAPESI